MKACRSIRLEVISPATKRFPKKTTGIAIPYWMRSVESTCKLVEISTTLDGNLTFGEGGTT
jgi:hypothetical protein